MREKKLSLYKILLEAEQDLEDWSAGLEDDDGSQQAQRNASMNIPQNPGDVWAPGQALLPDEDLGVGSDIGEQTSTIDIEAIQSFIQRAKKSGGITAQDLQVLRSLAPAGDLENLANEMEQNNPREYNQLLGLGLENAIESSSNQFKARPTSSLSLQKAMPQQVQSQPQASWSELISQNPHYAAALEKQKSGARLSATDRNLLNNPYDPQTRQIPAKTPTQIPATRDATRQHSAPTLTAPSRKAITPLPPTTAVEPGATTQLSLKRKR